MRHREKVEAYKRFMQSRGVVDATSVPPLWKLFWSIGIELPPPPFIGFWPLFFLSGAVMGPILGIALWLCRGLMRHHLPSLHNLGGVVIFASLISGLFIAVGYRSLARKHRLPSWSDFPAREDANL